MTKRQASRRLGREAIEAIKNEWRDGDGIFDGVHDAREWLKDQGIKASYNQVSGWLRSAYYEMHDDGNSVTFPSKVNGYARQAFPVYADRVASREPRLSDTATRLKNDLRVAVADAQQADASPGEKAKPKLLRAAKEMIEAIAELR